MGVREYVLPVYRRWATFVARTPEPQVVYSRHRFCCIPSVGRLGETSPMSSSITGETRGRLTSRGQYRYFSNYNRGSDDDESKDLREQKSAFLRALEGDKTNKGNADGQRKKTSRSNPPKSRRQKNIDESDNDNNNNAVLRKRNKTTTTAPLKKLTLDEFFSNLEETKAKELSSQPNTRKRSRSRISSKDGKLGDRQLRPPYNNDNHNSNAAPAADMNSFFDEVNALMDRKGKEKEELHATTTSPTNEINSIDSNPNVRPSVSDLFPPISSAGNDSDLEDRNSVGYNCSIESWDQYSDLIEEVIEGPKFLARFHSKKSGNTSEDEAERVRQIGEVVEWLRSKTPLIEAHLPTLIFALTGEVSNASDEPESEVTENGGDGEMMTATDSSYTSRRELFRGELDSQRESFLNNVGWTKKQYEVATGALVAMGNLCAKNCTSPPLDVAWSKLKELGYPMKNKDVLHNYLYVASTFSLPKRKFSLAGEIGGDGSSPSVLDLLYGTSDSSSTISSDDDLDDEIDLSAEVALCHDFLHEATEQSTGIHVRRLVELGKANEAELLLEATMVS